MTLPDRNPPENVTLTLPEEFIALCRTHGIPPESVLRGFIADLCGLGRGGSAPRSDGYQSHGSDERSYAQRYYERVGYPWWNAQD